MDITNNKKEFRFEAILEDEKQATLSYRWLKGSMVLLHTVVPAGMRGTGVGSTLVKFVLDYVAEHHLKIIVYCPFVAQYIQRNPEYGELLNSLP